MTTWAFILGLLIIGIILAAFNIEATIKRVVIAIVLILALMWIFRRAARAYPHPIVSLGEP